MDREKFEFKDNIAYGEFSAVARKKRTGNKGQKKTATPQEKFAYSDGYEVNPFPVVASQEQIDCDDNISYGEFRTTSPQKKKQEASNDYILLGKDKLEFSQSDFNFVPQRRQAARKGQRKIILVLAVMILLLVLLTLAMAVSWIYFALEISKLKSETPTNSLSTSSLTLLNSSVEDIYKQLLASNVSIGQWLNSESQKLNTSLIQNILQVNQALSVVEDAIRLPGRFSIFPASSCAALPPSSPSGYYWVATTYGSAKEVYCDMTRSCGGVIGGWMRVADLDLTNSSHQCPSGLMESINSSIRTCINANPLESCSSHTYDTFDIGYTRVCGKIIGYQIGITNAFARTQENINTFYVDGVSLTHGRMPREHIWTFAAARDETNVAFLPSKCLCIADNGESFPPSFVQNDYFCDTGTDSITGGTPFLGDDPLWDGAGCGSTSTCCSFNTPPWFYKQLPQLTTDGIEMRVCRNEPKIHEDIAIESVELYIR